MIILTMMLILLPVMSYCYTVGMPGWTYRKSHVINGSSGAGTNYQVRIVAHKATGSDSGPDVYLGTNVRDDFGDVRFTADDGMTLLDYWLETGSLASGSQAAFWVEVAADLGSSQAIYIYYGNGSSTTTSDGANTFILFDDFTIGPLSGNWTKKNGGTPSFAGGLMTVTANNVDPGKIIATGGPTADNNAIVARFKVTGGNNSGERAGVGVRTGTADGRGFNYVLSDGSTWTSYNKISFLDDAIAWGSSTTNSWSTNTFYNFEILHDGTNVRGRINYGTWYTQGWTSRSGYLALNIGSFDATTVWDWAAIRKCIATEPAHGSWGAQENAVYETWSMAGWSYRKCHNINPASGSGTNYQVMVTVNYGSGTDASGTVYCGSHCQTNFSDIRFTASDGFTPLNYWMQSYTSGSNAVFWVQVQDDLSSSSQKIYIYYGKTGVTTTSSGTNTFIYYDDGSTTAGWTTAGTVGSSSTQGNPVPSLRANGAVGSYLYRNTGIGPNTFTFFNVRTDAANLGNFFFQCNSAGSGQMYRLDARGSSNYTGFATTTSWTTWTAPGGTTTSLANTWYRFGIAINSAGTSSTLYYNAGTSTNPVPGTALGTYSTTNSGTYIGLVGDGGGASLYTYWDNIITRKYVSPEPAHSTWCAEETPLVLSLSWTNISCYGNDDGSVTATVTGGSTPYSYLWSNLQTTPALSGLKVPGEYTVTVTDTPGQSVSASATITMPGPVITTSTTYSNPTCFDESDGSITITATGGAAPYTFSIDNGATYPGSGSNPYTFNGLPAGSNYRIKVKDSNGCTSPEIP
jgi:hypothetical protein